MRKRALPSADTENHLSRRHVSLLILLAAVVMFEGFDISTTSVVLPYLAHDFAAATEELGNALAIIGLGSVAAWGVLRLSDRFGRRPMLLLASAGFSLGSLVTILSTSVATYTVIQFVTRILLVSQVALAYLVASETLPPELRGRANGLLGAMGSFGAALPFLLIGTALKTVLAWRLLFVVGALPLVLLPLLFLYVHETPVWIAAQKGSARSASPMAELRQLLAPRIRRPFAAMSLFWLIVNFASAAGGLFFTLYVVGERGWPASDFALIAPFGLAGAFVGYLGAGTLADAIGRRPTASLFFALLGIATFVCYTAHGWYAIAASFVGLQAMLGIWVIAYTLNSELFPTDLRGAANGWCNNLIGRWGMVAAPAIVGGVSGIMGGAGPAIAAISPVAWLGIPVVLFLMPETRGQRLGDDLKGDIIK